MITSSKDASCFISAAITSHQTRWESCLESEKYIVDLDPPFDDAKLKESANWSHNYNYGKGLAQLNKVTKLNVSEISKAISLIQINFNRFDPKVHKELLYMFLFNNDSRERMCEIIETTISEFIERQEEYTTFVSQSEYMSGMFGFAACVEDIQSFFPKVVHVSNVAFEDHTHVNNVGRFAIFDTIKGDYFLQIYKTIKDEDASHSLNAEDDSWICDNGWNKKEVLNLLCSIFNNDPECIDALCDKNGKKGCTPEEKSLVKYQSWEDVNFITAHKGDIWFTYNVNNIIIARILEPHGDKVIENYVSLGHGGSHLSTATLASISGILYHKVHEKTSINKIVTLVTDFSIKGSEFIHDLKGFSKILAEHSSRYDMARNILADKLMLYGSYWIQKPNANRPNAAPLAISVNGGIVQVSHGIQFPVLQQKIDISPCITAMEIEEREHAQIFESYIPQTKLSNRPTRQEVDFVNQEAYQNRAADIPFKLKSYSKILMRMLRNIAEDDKYDSENYKQARTDLITRVRESLDEFMDVSDSDILKIIKEISEVIISPVMSDRDAIQFAIANSGNSRSRRRLMRMLLSSYGFSYSQIKTIVDDQEYGRDAEIAAFENAVFINSREVVFSPSQDHIVHLDAHFYKINTKLQGIPNGEDPVAVFNLVTNALTNTALHLQAIQANPFYQKQVEFYEDNQMFFETQRQNLARMLDKMRNEAQADGQEQQANGNNFISPEVQQKMAEKEAMFQQKMAITKARTEQAQALAVERQKFNQAMRQQQVEFEKEMKASKTEAEVSALFAKAAAEMAKPKN